MSSNIETLRKEIEALARELWPHAFISESRQQGMYDARVSEYSTQCHNGFGKSRIDALRALKLEIGTAAARIVAMHHARITAAQHVIERARKATP